MPNLDTIKLKKKSRILELVFDDGLAADLSCELLRVYSPSAEVVGHGTGQSILQTGKEFINITAIEPVGNYAIKLIFDDGHDTGIYTWNYLYQLAKHKESKWHDYIDALAQAGYTRKNDE
jgi:DUF971 family protein